MGQRGLSFDRLDAGTREATPLYAHPTELLREALERIAAIEDKMVGPDWEEIEEARSIARAALASAPAPTLPSAVWFPDAAPLLRGVERALRRHLDGHAPRRIPADDSDSDILLADVRAALTSTPAPTLTEEQIDRLWEAACEGPTSAVSAFARSIWELALASPTGDTRPDYWPSVKVTVHEDEVKPHVHRVTAELYAPGLPPGEYDMYLPDHPTESQSQKPEAADAAPSVLTPPPHPESQVMVWSALELAAIRAYGERCWCAGRSTG
jgi:hypothetical protein